MAGLASGISSQVRSSPRISTPLLCQRFADHRQELAGDVGMHEQRLGRVADAHALALAVDHDLAGHVEIGGRVDVHVAVAVEVFDDGHLGFGGDAANQAFAAARNRQVDVLGHRQELADGGAVGRADHLHRIGRQAASSAASASSSTIAWLEWIASLPPRRITALPDFTQIAAASAVTLGRDS